MRGRDLAGFTGAGYDKGRGPVWQVAWLSCQSLFLRRWFVPPSVRAVILRAFGARLGRGVLVREGVTIHWPWKLTVGDDSWIGVGTWILNLEPVVIGRNTCISQAVLLCTGSHDRRSPTFEFDNGPIHIGDQAWIAARATVLRGVKVGNGAVVGACALVTRDVSPGAVVLAPAGETPPSKQR
jgi:putative colanic acid biosynthesis acetyltransferase WcaF